LTVEVPLGGALWPILLAPLLLDSVLRGVLLVLRVTVPARFAAGRGRAAGGGPSGKCVALIAARDEAGVIGPSVAALQAELAACPGSRLWVVADRCRDATAAEARAAGARVDERRAGRASKGAAIEWWLRTQAEEWQSDDIIVVLDADSRLAPGSLRALTEALEWADAAQAFVAPQAAGGLGRQAGWSEVLMQCIDDEARRRSGWSVPLRGTGMAVRAGLLAELAPRLHTLVEDLELDVLLAARGARVAFVPEAVVIDPKPRRADGAARQRARWLRGQLQVLRGYWGEMWRAAWRGGWQARLSAWMLLTLLMLRPKTLFIGLRVAGLFTAAWRLALAGLALDAAYYLAAVGVVSERRRYLLDLCAAPRYAAVWVWGLSLAALRRGWLRAGR
jgi:cellulose synthase/poly-beta-1,6-N-acetylglucosamine synthase-like glycosyltransferase